MDAVFSAAKENNVARLEDLIDGSRLWLIDAANESGKTPISIAVESNSADAAKWLIERGCRLTLTEDTAVSAVSQSMVPEEVLPATAKSGQFYPPLLAAVASHSTQMATLLLQAEHVEVDEAYRDVTPLIRACTEGLRDMVTLLLDHGADVNGRQISDDDLDLETENPREWEHRPLYHAVEHGHADLVEILAKRGARYVNLGPLPCHNFWATQNIQLQRCWGSILELAVVKCCPKVEFLLDFYRVNISGLDAYYALALSVTAKRIPMVRLFLDKYYLTPSGEIPGRLELCNNYWLVIRLAVRECKEEETIPILLLQRFGVLLADDADRSRIVSLLFVAVLRNLPGVVAKVARILTSHFDVAALKECPSAGTLLRDVRGMALYHGNQRILETLQDSDLLDLHIFPDAIFEVLACERTGTGASVYDTLCWLMERGLDPSVRNINSMQPIHAAVKQKLPEAVNALCCLGVDADSQIGTEDALSPLQVHMDLCVLQLGTEPQADVMNMLISHGADLGKVNVRGYTPISVLFWLVEASSRENISQRPLISCRYELASISNMRCLPIHAAFVRVSRPALYAEGEGHGDDGCRGAEGEFHCGFQSSGRQCADDSMEPFSATSPHSAPSSTDLLRDMAESPVPPSPEISDDSRVPSYLLPGSPHRAFLETLTSKFGLELLAMGSATLIGHENWHRMHRHLHKAGVQWRHVPSLKALCWRKTQRSIGSVRFQEKVDLLPLPNALKAFLKKL
ncbi:ankyrin-3-like [Littorina saxatilis]|uniref:SOCS box domain-containing protein n=1 Tax=Littorina saxatilis TaxID=31220 RepID=A0AAN9G2A1_9CAEN